MQFTPHLYEISGFNNLNDILVCIMFVLTKDYRFLLHWNRICVHERRRVLCRVIPTRLGQLRCWVQDSCSRNVAQKGYVFSCSDRVLDVLCSSA